MARPTDQEIKDLRDQPKVDAAYDRSLRMTAPTPAASKPKKMAKGGVTRADGCITKGHTRGKMV